MVNAINAPRRVLLPLLLIPLWLLLLLLLATLPINRLDFCDFFHFFLLRKKREGIRGNLVIRLLRLKMKGN